LYRASRRLLSVIFRVLWCNCWIFRLTKWKVLIPLWYLTHRPDQKSGCDHMKIHRTWLARWVSTLFSSLFDNLFNYEWVYELLISSSYDEIQHGGKRSDTQYPSIRGTDEHAPLDGQQVSIQYSAEYQPEKRSLATGISIY